MDWGGVTCRKCFIVLLVKDALRRLRRRGLALLALSDLFSKNGLESKLSDPFLEKQIRQGSAHIRKKPPQAMLCLRR
mgnify:FL=1